MNAAHTHGGGSRRIPASQISEAGVLYSAARPCNARRRGRFGDGQRGRISASTAVHQRTRSAVDGGHVRFVVARAGRRGRGSRPDALHLHGRARLSLRGRAETPRQLGSHPRTRRASPFDRLELTGPGEGSLVLAAWYERRDRRPSYSSSVRQGGHDRPARGPHEPLHLDAGGVRPSRHESGGTPPRGCNTSASGPARCNTRRNDPLSRTLNCTPGGFTPSNPASKTEADENQPICRTFYGRGWFRTTALSRVKRPLRTTITRRFAGSLSTDFAFRARTHCRGLLGIVAVVVHGNIRGPAAARQMKRVLLLRGGVPREDESPELSDRQLGPPPRARHSA